MTPHTTGNSPSTATRPEGGTARVTGAITNMTIRNRPPSAPRPNIPTPNGNPRSSSTNPTPSNGSPTPASANLTAYAATNLTHLTHPRPRPAKSAEEVRRIRVRNRRREWLGRNEKYFDNVENEFADPMLYEELVRRWQSPAERRDEDERKGYGRVLEGDLMRGEARIEGGEGCRIADPNGGYGVDQEMGEGSGGGGRLGGSGGIGGQHSGMGRGEGGGRNGVGDIGNGPSAASVLIRDLAARRGQPRPPQSQQSRPSQPPQPQQRQQREQQQPEDIEMDHEPEHQPPLQNRAINPPSTATLTALSTHQDILIDPPQTKAGALHLWHSFLEERFVRGEDEDFRYEGVDLDDGVDETEEREREEEWFEGEEAGWVGSEGEDGGSGDGSKGDRVLVGETGVQDF